MQAAEDVANAAAKTIPGDGLAHAARGRDAEPGGHGGRCILCLGRDGVNHKKTADALAPALVGVLEVGSAPETDPAGETLAPGRQAHGGQTVRR